MRIGMLSYGLHVGLTGIGRYTVNMIHALATQRSEVEVILLATEPTDRYGLWDKFETHHLPFCRLAPALISIGNLAIADAVRRYELDIVHDPNGLAPFFYPQSRAKRVVTIHDAFAFTCPHEHNRFDNLRYRYHLPYALRCADAITTTSESSKTDIVRYLGVNPSRIINIFAGVDGKFARIADAEERHRVLDRYGIKGPYLLYLGGINGRKNIARLFEAFSLVRQRHPQLTLVVGGPRQWRTAAIDEAFTRLSIADSTHFTGYVDDADLPALYSAAELFVFPSLYEGFGLPPLEAMACGTPVITSRASSLPEVVGDAAVLVNPYDVQALADAINRVLTDQAVRSDLAARGPARAAQFTWQQVAQSTLAVYDRTLNSAHLGIGEGYGA